MKTLPTVLALLLCAAPLAAQVRMVNCFETDTERKAVKPYLSTVRFVKAHTATSKTAMQIDFGAGDWPGVTFPVVDGDWSKAGGLALDVTNPGKEIIHFSIRIDDPMQSQGHLHCRSANMDLAPEAHATFYVSLQNDDPMKYGMRALPSPIGMTPVSVYAEGPFDAAHIVQYLLFTHNPPPGAKLIVDNVRLAPSTSLDKFIDEFGQYNRADWPGKIHSEVDFAAQRKAEEATLAPMPGRDEYGGWSDGPTLNATGFFRTQLRNGKWWLVDPAGRLFFSVGANVTEYYISTVTTGREKMFTWLPAPTDPMAKLKQHYNWIHAGPLKEADTFPFYEANLVRKYGTDFRGAWMDETARRYASWGFNTVGNWSDQDFARQKHIPYVINQGVQGEYAHVSSGSDYWSQMSDPFDPAFEAAARRSTLEVANGHKTDPYLLGYFIDNELSWRGYGPEGELGLAFGSLALDSKSPAKMAFVAQLKQAYGDIDKWNTAWGEKIAGWKDLEAPFVPVATATAARKADMSAFVLEFARRYFKVVSTAMHEADPNHLYLGCRFAWYGDEAVKAGAEYSDVVSFNVYDRSLDAKKWAFTATLNKPCIIGEFHFGALDRGMFHPGLVAAKNQQERADLYGEYVQSVTANPAFIGCHWFEFVDEPVTGRWFDGENYNIGFLSVTDTPYRELVTAARAVHADMYRLHDSTP